MRAPAALSVPGDAVAGAAAAGTLGPATAGLVAASVCLYWGGMAANDWADRELDARERPERPVPSGRISPGQALGVAAGLTAAGVGLAALAAGRRGVSLALPLAGAVWAYDLRAKNTAAGPLLMSVCRGLDVLLGAGRGRIGRAVPAALTVAAHTYTVTALSRREVSGGGAGLPAATVAGTVAVAAAAVLSTPGTLRRPGTPRRPGLAGTLRQPGPAGTLRQPGPTGTLRRPGLAGTLRLPGLAGTLRRPGLAGALAAWYAVQYGAAQVRAAADPSPGRFRAAVGAGITGLPPLQGALAARAGAPVAGLAVAAATPLARRLARVVSPT